MLFSLLSNIKVYFVKKIEMKYFYLRVTETHMRDQLCVIECENNSCESTSLIAKLNLSNMLSLKQSEHINYLDKA